MNALSLLRPAAFAAALFCIGACSTDAPLGPDGRDDASGGGLARLAPAMVRSIDEFIVAQGGGPGSGTSVPAGMVPGAIAWTDGNSGLTAVVDYAGAMYRRENRPIDTDPIDTDPDDTEPLAPNSGAAGTVATATPIAGVDAPGAPAFDGRISEQILIDGSVRVSIELHSKGALAFAVKGRIPFTDEIAYGSRSYRDPEGARAYSRLLLVYRASKPGLPLPNVSELVYQPPTGLRFELIAFAASAAGIDAYASPLGTLVVEQPGLRASDPIYQEVGSLPAARVGID